MADLETDYLVVGAGASGMAFVDALIAQSSASVVMVDRRHRPGGHWLDAYPFVRLHQTSANYGVNSRPLGNDRIDTWGPNAGFYERATASEICDYFQRVLDDLVATGRLRFIAMSDYRGEDTDGHHVTSLLTGRDTVISARKLVDATYVESTIPSRHTPGFVIDSEARVVPPNDLVDLDAAPAGFTVIGGGKTGMDTCGFLLDNGVAPDKIQWIKSRDAWLFNRALMQPLELVGSYMQLQASWVKAASEAEDGMDFARQLEADDVLMRVDDDVDADMFRAAIMSKPEVDGLRSIENVVRMGKVRRVSADRVILDGGEVASTPDQLYIDCTAAGIRPTVQKPIFDGDRITIQYVTLGIVPWGSAVIGAVEALKDDDADKNRLCPALRFTGHVADVLTMAYAGMSGLSARGADRDLAGWNAGCRLDPARAAVDHMDDPRVTDAFATIGARAGAAFENLAKRTAEPVATESR